MQTLNVVVIGGGITGLTAALRLRQWSESTKQSENPMDIQCMVCEQSEKFGGKIRTLKSNRLVIETGPDSIFTRNPAAIEFMQELGLSDDIVQISSSCGTMVWHDNKLRFNPSILESCSLNLTRS